MTIMVYAPHTIQWKHLQTGIVLCQNLRNISFILQKKKNCNGKAASDTVIAACVQPALATH